MRPFLTSASVLGSMTSSPYSVATQTICDIPDAVSFSESILPSVVPENINGFFIIYTLSV